MKKLELKHIVNHALNKGIVLADNSIWSISNICFQNEIIELFNEHNAGNYEFSLDKIKLILRPLSSIVEEINYNGKTFIPASKMITYGFHNKIWYEYEEFNYLFLYELDIEKLLKWYFDIYGLIDKGLAVPVTEEFNPYK